MPLHLLELSLLLCIVICILLYWRKSFSAKEIIIKTLRNSLDILPIGAYVCYVENGKKSHLFTNLMAQTIYDCDKLAFLAAGWSYTDDNEADSGLINQGESYFLAEKKMQIPNEGVKYIVVEKKKLSLDKQNFFIITTLVDVTEQKRYQLLLEEIQEDIALAMNAGKASFWKYNAQIKRFDILFLNKQQAMDGLHLDDALEMIHPEERLAFLKQLNSLVSGEQEEGEMVLRTKDRETGIYIYYKNKLSRRYDPLEDIVYIIGSQRDITKQMEDEAIIKQNADFLQTVLDNIPFPIHAKDVVDGCKYLFWNKASRLLFGENEQGTASQLLIPQQAQRIDDLDKQIYESSKSYQGQEQLCMLDGRVIDTIVYKNIIYYGTKKMILTVRWDVGELIRLKHTLEDLRRRDEIIINNTNSGLAYITADFIVQWENISICTPDIAYEAYKRGELCYKSSYNRDEPCENCLLKRVMQSKKVEQKEFKLLNGRHVEVFANPVFKHNGELEGIVIRLDDITERQKIIEDLRSAKEKAEESDKLKSSFLANISHEIRTPLNAIVGFSSLLLHSQNDEEKEMYSKIIANNNELLLRLMNDILELSVIESDIIDLKEREIFLSDIFEEAEASLNLKLNKGVSLISEVPENRSTFSIVDPERLKLVLTSLLINAIKFTTQGSIRLGYEYVDGGVRCYVADTGIGISSEHCDRIFGRFEKVDPFSQGTGLGLSICKAIAEAYGGKIGVKSELGVGSTFWVWLPSSE